MKKINIHANGLAPTEALEAISLPIMFLVSEQVVAPLPSLQMVHAAEAAERTLVEQRMRGRAGRTAASEARSKAAEA